MRQQSSISIQRWPSWFSALVVVLVAVVASAIVSVAPASARQAGPENPGEMMFEGSNIYAPNVMWDEEEGIYKMWYGGWQTGVESNDTIYYRTSEDRRPNSWSAPQAAITPAEPNAVVRADPELHKAMDAEMRNDFEVWERANPDRETGVEIEHVNDPTVTKHFNGASNMWQYTMFYTVCASLHCISQNHTAVWSAVSADGISWSHHKPLINPECVADTNLETTCADKLPCRPGKEPSCGAGEPFAILGSKTPGAFWDVYYVDRLNARNVKVVAVSGDREVVSTAELVYESPDGVTITGVELHEFNDIWHLFFNVYQTASDDPNSVFSRDVAKTQSDTRYKFAGGTELLILNDGPDICGSLAPGVLPLNEASYEIYYGVLARGGQCYPDKQETIEKRTFASPAFCEVEVASPQSLALGVIGGSRHYPNQPVGVVDGVQRWKAAIRFDISGLEVNSDPANTCFTYRAIERNRRHDDVLVASRGLQPLLLDTGTWDIELSAEFLTPRAVGVASVEVLPAPVGLPVGGEPGYGLSAADEAVSWDADTGTWSIRNADGSVGTARWGTAGDVPLVGDVDGDGVADRVVWRASNGRWYGQNKAGETILNKGWGTRGDVPLLGDVDGDGHDDMIIWRPSNGRWYVKSSANYTTLMDVAWGHGSLGDIPLVGDLDGDGRDDIIIWRPKTGSSNNGRFYAKNFDGTTIFNRSWGAGRLGDIPLIGDVDGDGADEVVIFRPSSARWYPKSIDNTRPVKSIRHGAAGGHDVPMMFDADGDGDDDAVIVRNYNGKTYWYGRDSANQQLPFYGVQLGAEGDTTLAGNYS